MKKNNIKNIKSNIYAFVATLIAVIALPVEGRFNAEAASNLPQLKKVLVYEGVRKIRLVALFDGPLKPRNLDTRIKDSGVSVFVPGVVGGKPHRQFNVGQGGYEHLDAREGRNGLFISVLTKSGVSHPKKNPEVVIEKSTLTLTLPVLTAWRKGEKSASRTKNVSMISAAGGTSRRTTMAKHRLQSKKKITTAITPDAMLNQIFSSPHERTTSLSRKKFNQVLKGKGKDDSKKKGHNGKNNVAVNSVKNLKSFLKPAKRTESPYSNLSGTKTQKNSNLATNVENFSTVAMKFTVALGGILATILGIFFFFKKVAPGAVAKFGGNGSLVRTLHKTTLAPKKSLAVVEVAGEVLVLGISGQNIAMLTKIESEDALARVRSVGESSFVEHLSTMLGKEVDKIENPVSEEKGPESSAPVEEGVSTRGDLKEEIEDKKVAAILAYARQSENGLNPGQDLKSGTQSRATSDFNTARTRNARKGVPTSKRTASRLRNRLDRLPALSEGAVVS